MDFLNTIVLNLDTGKNVEKKFIDNFFGELQILYK